MKEIFISKSDNISKIVLIENGNLVEKYEENDRNVTYSYTDVLTRTVEVEVFDGESYSPLIPPLVDAKKKKIL